MRNIIKYLSVGLTVIFILFLWKLIQNNLEQSADIFSNPYVVTPNIIAIENEREPSTYDTQNPYQFHNIYRQQIAEGKSPLVTRGWKFISSLVNRNQKLAHSRGQSLLSIQLDKKWLNQARNYSVQVYGDHNYENPVTPTAVYRKSKPVDIDRTGHKKIRFPMKNTLYLSLPFPLIAGQEYIIQFASQHNKEVELLNFQHTPSHQITEAIHVSQIGFRPDDLSKIGFLSTWMGTGGKLSYPESLAFYLIDEVTGQSVFSGHTRLRQQSQESEDDRGRRYTFTDVYELDFSPFNQPGEYRLCVQNVGCSQSFAIAANAWQSAFYIAARGFYHQRSGIALGPPYTEVVRPRPFHPDDGLVVYQSTASLMNTGNGLNAQGTDEGNFANLIAGQTDEIVPNAWGGYFDAGDWDRRIQHLDVSRKLLELLELFPEYFDSFDLNLPESANNLPDILDEALWSVDFFKRLQTNDGGIRGGIESSGHPKKGETSWQESQTVLAYAPGPWSSYIYAGVAARATRLLEQYDPAKALGYQRSAFAAMEFAEQRHREGIDVLDAVKAVIDATRALAALELYRLTTERQWYQQFLDAIAQVEANPEADYRIDAPLREIAFVYSQLPAELVEPQLARQLRAEILRQADQAVKLTQSTAFGWTKIEPGVPIGWGHGLGSPKVITLLRAYTLTGNSKYLEAAVLGCQFSAGANPDNMTFTTGVGHRSPQHPLVVDQHVMGEPPPPGITVYGPVDPEAYGHNWMFDQFETVTTPPLREWPTVETYLDVYKVPIINEFTVMQSMKDVAYAWGYLSARETLDNP